MDNERHLEYGALIRALDGELSPMEAQAALEHVQTCESCSAEWQRAKAVSAAIEALHCMTPVARPKSARRITTYAAAACAIAAAAAWWVWVPRAGLPPSAPVRHLATLSGRQPLAAPALAHTRLRRRVHVREAVEPTTVRMRQSSFVPLLFSDDALPLADAPVVRMQLPAEELRLAGVTVQGVSPGASVEADVLLGADGLPRAIRVASDGSEF